MQGRLSESQSTAPLLRNITRLKILEHTWTTQRTPTPSEMTLVPTALPLTARWAGLYPTHSLRAQAAPVGRLGRAAVTG